MSRRRPPPRKRPNPAAGKTPATPAPIPSTPTLKDVLVQTGELTLIQVLKLVGEAETGGAAKAMVDEGRIIVNGEPESRKRRQMTIGDVLTIDAPDGPSFRLVLDPTTANHGDRHAP